MSGLNRTVSRFPIVFKAKNNSLIFFFNSLLVKSLNCPAKIIVFSILSKTQQWLHIKKRQIKTTKYSDKSIKRLINRFLLMTCQGRSNRGNNQSVFWNIQMKRLICLKVFSPNTLTECDTAWMEAPLQRRKTLRSLTEVVMTKKPPVQDTKRKLCRCSSFMKPDHGFNPSKHLIGSSLLLIQRHTEGRQLRGEEYYLTKRAQVCIIGL